MSRASGAPLVANALEFAGQLVKGKVFEVAAKEFAAAEKAGLSKILAERKAAAKGAAADEEEVKAPPAEPCTASIPGIEVMDLEDAAKVLWKAGIYAETGMGCTGPLVMMSDANPVSYTHLEVLKAEGKVLVDFYGDGCVPCAALMPHVHAFAETYGDKIKFCALNTTKARRLADVYKRQGQGR